MDQHRRSFNVIPSARLTPAGAMGERYGMKRVATIVTASLFALLGSVSGRLRSPRASVSPPAIRSHRASRAGRAPGFGSARSIRTAAIIRSIRCPIPSNTRGRTRSANVSHATSPSIGRAAPSPCGACAAGGCAARATFASFCPETRIEPGAVLGVESTRRPTRGNLEV